MSTIKFEATVSNDITNNKPRHAAIMSSVNAFKAAIIRIRDIFRGLTPSITGMESMRHICLYLLSRYMTKDRVKSLGLPEDFAWEKIIETVQTKNGGVQKALDTFFHKEADCLVNHFDRLFGTRDFAFDINNPIKHKEILEILNSKDIDIEHIDLNMDILGWVYEQHLGKGSGGNSMRDLGQFFTDRFICNYMVKLCQPGFKSKGVPESICDPSMGTGGFLTSYIKFYKEYYTDKPVDWSVQNKEIHGCDTDQKIAGVARLNLFMETGGNVVDNLQLRNSLNNDLIQTGYDLILANMPFGLKGLKFKDCCERIKALKIDGTKSEPLFLQLMMISLNRGGRCAVVVPDGMLVNSSVCHDETRKYLLDHFEVKRVIKMKGQFFMNTGIQPSILFFENTGKPTSAVEFWDVIKGANGDIEETMMLSVPRAKFDASCSLDMRRYQEVKAMANPAGFPMVKLGDIAFNKKYPSHDTSVGKESGSSKFHTGGKFTRLYTDTPDIKDTIVIVNRTNGGGKSNIFIDSNCSVAKQTLVMSCENSITTRYLYFWLSLNKKEIEKGYIGSNHKNLSTEFVKNMSMPLPPLETQQEIVATLDRIYAPGTTELAETLKLTDKAMNLVLANPGGASLEPIVEAQRLIRKSAQMVADVKAQMVVDVKAQMVAIVRASFASVGCKKYILSDLANDNPESLTKADKFDTINYVDLGSVKEGVISSVQSIAFAEKPSRAQRKIKDGDIIWGGVRPLSRSYAYVGTAVENMIGSSGFIVVRNKDNAKVLSKYLYYAITTDECVSYLNSHSTGTSYPAFNSVTIMAYEVNVPPIAVQVRTLERLEALQSQLTALESLQKQTEDNARFILDSYLSSSHISEAPHYASESDSESNSVHISDEEEFKTNSIIIPTLPSQEEKDYKSMSKADLLALCKEQNIKGVSGKNKEALIEILSK